MPAKRKVDANDKLSTKTKMDVDGDEDSGSDEDMNIINVDFEWFDPAPDVDFHGLKTLMRQLFDVDNQLFDLSALADMILAQPQLGSTVKCDGLESDPFAFLTILDLQKHREVSALQTLTSYLLGRSATASSPPLSQHLTPLLSAQSSARVGLILNERFINMPHQIVPPLYRMLATEMAGAPQSEKFTHYLVISKTYTEVASKLDLEAAPPSKKQKAPASNNAEVFYFHPEDEVLQKHAVASGYYDYERVGDEGASDAKRAFQEMGIRPQGHLILLEAGKFEGAVKAVEEYLGGS